MGSEMCIRDRINNDFGRRPLALKVDVNNTLTVQDLQDGVDGTIGCLLYTSDAADDLLCVDLGGRRIIKKKNL